MSLLNAQTNRTVGVPHKLLAVHELDIASLNTIKVQAMLFGAVRLLCHVAFNPGVFEGFKWVISMCKSSYLTHFNIRLGIGYSRVSSSPNLSVSWKNSAACTRHRLFQAFHCYN